MDTYLKYVNRFAFNCIDVALIFPGNIFVSWATKIEKKPLYKGSVASNKSVLLLFSSLIYSALWFQRYQTVNISVYITIGYMLVNILIIRRMDEIWLVADGRDATSRLIVFQRGDKLVYRTSSRTSFRIETMLARWYSDYFIVAMRAALLSFRQIAFARERYVGVYVSERKKKNESLDQHNLLSRPEVSHKFRFKKLKGRLSTFKIICSTILMIAYFFKLTCFKFYRIIEEYFGTIFECTRIYKIKKKIVNSENISEKIILLYIFFQLIRYKFYRIIEHILVQYFNM